MDRFEPPHRRGRRLDDPKNTVQTGCRGRQPLPFENYLQTHRCNGIWGRFGLTKAFLREEGGTRQGFPEASVRALGGPVGLACNRRAKCGAWNPSLCDGMASRAACLYLRIDAIHHFVMIPFAPSSRFHAATSCGLHTRLRRDWDAEDAHQTHGQIRPATR